MADAVEIHRRHYPGPNGENQWFGHPARQPAELTVNGSTITAARTTTPNAQPKQ
jgi:hypothetical protein